MITKIKIGMVGSRTYTNKKKVKDLIFEIKESIPCGDECANFAHITNKINGAEIKTKMIVIYRVNSNDKIVSLRAFWDYQAMENQMNKLFSGD